MSFTTQKNTPKPILLSIVGHVDVVLYDGIPGQRIEPMRPCMGVTPGKTEDAAPADDRHFPHLGENCVASQDAEVAPVVLPLAERKVEDHEEPSLLLGSERIDPLCPPDNL